MVETGTLGDGCPYTGKALGHSRSCRCWLMPQFVGNVVILPEGVRYVGLKVPSRPIPEPPRGASDKLECAEQFCQVKFKRLRLVYGPYGPTWEKQGPYCSVECEAWDRDIKRGKK